MRPGVALARRVTNDTSTAVVAGLLFAVAVLPARSLPYGLGMPTFVAALAGLVPMWTRHRRQVLPLAFFAVAFFVAIGSGRTVFFRYILPLLPLACLSAAVGIRTLSVWVAPRARMSPALATSVLAILVAALRVDGDVKGRWLRRLR